MGNHIRKVQIKKRSAGWLPRWRAVASRIPYWLVELFRLDQTHASKCLKSLGLYAHPIGSTEAEWKIFVSIVTHLKIQLRNRIRTWADDHQ